jgi:hypothetical protein
LLINDALQPPESVTSLIKLTNAIETSIELLHEDTLIFGPQFKIIGTEIFLVILWSQVAVLLQPSLNIYVLVSVSLQPLDAVMSLLEIVKSPHASEALPPSATHPETSVTAIGQFEPHKVKSNTGAHEIVGAVKSTFLTII